MKGVGRLTFAWELWLSGLCNGFPDTDHEFESSGSQSFLLSLFSLSHQFNFALSITRPTKDISLVISTQHGSFTDAKVLPVDS